jgi:hypothetical protein
VYGLMVYLPAYALPQRKTLPVRWWHYGLTIPLPFLFMAPWSQIYPRVIHVLGYQLIPSP